MSTPEETLALPGMEDTSTVFSPCRTWRYRLERRIPGAPDNTLLRWMALNPSTATSFELDPTLKRIWAFSLGFGFKGFVMLNIFGVRSPYPEILRQVPDPVGPDNDHWLLREAAAAPSWSAVGAITETRSTATSRWPRCWSPTATNSGLFASRRRGSPCTPFTSRATPRSFLSIPASGQFDPVACFRLLRSRYSRQHEP